MTPGPEDVFDAEPAFPRGFRGASRRCGIKEAGPDVAVIHTDPPAAAAALFTRNRFPGAPVVVGREVIRGGRLRAVVVNSGNANAATGAEGIRRAKRMAGAAAGELDVPVAEVLPASTGVIGRPLPVERIEAGLRGVRGELADDPVETARAMMTTDTHPKALSLRVGDATLTVLSKGSGMIAPDLATTLVWILTDAEWSPGELDGMLRPAAARTLEMLSIDGDTSTSDTCALLANGVVGPVDPEAFAGALETALERTCEVLARDGEGATRLLRATATGARTEDDARTVARAVVESPLVKTMAYGGDPNVGRLVMAVGKCADVEMDPGAVEIRLGGIPVFRRGAIAGVEPSRIREALRGDPVEIAVSLAAGDARAVAWGCDLGEGYIAENAAYSPS